MTHPVTGGAPPDFLAALHALREQRLRPEVELHEVPAPGRIAPFAVALSADVLDDGAASVPVGRHDPLATGRFVLLHDPAGNDTWSGTFRVVSYVRATLDPEVASDALLPQVAWSWFTDALHVAEAQPTAIGGTVTRVLSQGFGSLVDSTDDVEIEIRASWTPSGPAVGPDLLAWSILLSTTAGLPPLPAGVTAMSRR